MPTANNIQSPTEAPLVSPTSDVVPSNTNPDDNGKVQMKKQLGLVEGTAIILGIIFGSGKIQMEKINVIWKPYQFNIFCVQEFLYRRKE